MSPSCRSATSNGRTSSARPRWQVEAARAEAEARGVSSPEKVTTQRLLRRRDAAGRRPVEQRLRAAAVDRRAGSREGQRINMVTAIRRVLDQELEANPRVLVFGEDVGPEGRRPCGDARPAGEIRPRARVRHLAQRGRHRRPRGRHGARRADAGAGNPVPQICRAGDRADPRLRDDALAHQQPLRRADGAARAGRLLQMRRPVALR